MNTRSCFTRFQVAGIPTHNVSASRPVERRTFSSSKVLQKLGPIPSMSGVKNPELQAILTRFRENAVLPKHLAKNQQDLVYKKKYITTLENEEIIANISGEKFRLKHVDVLKDIPRLKFFIFDILPLMKEKEDWAVLPNVLFALKNIGFKISEPVSQKIVQMASLAGRQNVVLECLRRTRVTGMDFRSYDFLKTVLFWIQFKAVGQDNSAESINKTLSFAEQILEMLEDPKYTGNRLLHISNHQHNLPETLGMLLNIAALRASKFQEGRDKDGKVAAYAAKFVTKSKALPPPPTDKAVKEAQTLMELELKMKNLSESEDKEKFAAAKKKWRNKRTNFTQIVAKLLHWMMLNTQVVSGMKLALPLLSPDFEHKSHLSERLQDLEETINRVEVDWKQIHVIQGKEPVSFDKSRLLRMDSAEELIIETV